MIEKVEIGFIGIGAMGKIMASNIMKTFKIGVYNRTINKCDDLIGDRAIFMTPSEMVDKCDIIILMVSDNEACISIIDTISNSRHEKLIVINMSTISPDTSINLSKIMTNCNMDYIECPVAGSLPQASAKQLLILAGGSKLVFNKIRPILTEMGNPVFLGDVGNAAEMKLIINVNLAIQTAFLSETILIAKNSNIGVDKVLEIFNNGPLATVPSKFKSSNMLSGNYNSVFSLKHLHKDINYAKNMVKDGLNLPILSLLESLYHSDDESMNNLDFSAIMKIYEDKIINQS